MYVATVHKYCEETDMLTITYVSEPNQTYDEELLPFLSNSKLVSLVNFRVHTVNVC